MRVQEGKYQYDVASAKMLNVWCGEEDNELELHVIKSYKHKVVAVQTHAHRAWIQWHTWQVTLNELMQPSPQAGLRSQKSMQLCPAIMASFFPQHLLTCVA